MKYLSSAMHSNGSYQAIHSCATVYHKELDQCVMQFQGFDWLSAHEISAITMPEK